MKNIVFVLFCLFFFASCRQTIKHENVKINNGLYINSSNQKILNGKYKSTTPPEHAMSREDVITYEFSNGVPVGKWAETYGGELIHSGKYLKEENFKKSIQKLTKCYRVDLNLWKEMEHQFLTIELINPMVTDSLTLQKVVEITKNSLLEKHDFSEIIIDFIGITNNNYIFEYEIKK